MTNIINMIITGGADNIITITTNKVWSPFTTFTDAFGWIVLNGSIDYRRVNTESGPRINLSAI